MRPGHLVIRAMLVLVIVATYATKGGPEGGEAETADGDYMVAVVAHADGGVLHATRHAVMQVYYIPAAHDAAPRRLEAVYDGWLGGERVVAETAWSGSRWEPHALEVPRAVPGFDRDYVVRVIDAEGNVEAQATVAVAAAPLAWLGTMLALSTIVLILAHLIVRREKAAQAPAPDA